MHNVKARFKFQGGKISVDFASIDSIGFAGLEKIQNLPILENLDFWDAFVDTVRSSIYDRKGFFFSSIRGLPTFPDVYFDYLQRNTATPLLLTRNKIRPQTETKYLAKLERHIESAANKNYSFAQKLMGDFWSAGQRWSDLDIYDLGDDEKSFEWYKKAAKQGLTNELYEMGFWCEQLFSKSAISYYQVASDNGNMLASAHLAALTIKGKGVEQNTNIAYQLAQKVIEHDPDNLLAIWALGKCLEIGNNDVQDIQGAFHCYEKAALEKGTYGCELIPDAVFDLARCYESGLGTACDPIKAFRLYQKALDHGSDEAIYALGRCYEFGIGAEIDLPRALKYYKRAAHFGNDHARDAMKRCKS